MSGRTTPAEIEPTLAGHYAGVVSRGAAYVLDLLLVSGLYVLGVQVLVFVWGVLARGDLSLGRAGWPFVVGYTAWYLLYYGYSWAAAGKTPGKALLGIRIVRRDGADLEPRRALLRLAVYWVSVATAGVGFLFALVTRERRALHDLVAGTVVVYDWDARAAKLRFLARRPVGPPRA